METCMEIKYSLSGKKTLFHCERIAFHDCWGILKYVLDTGWQVQDIVLPPGTVTYGFYWQARPYNLYWWMDPRGQSLAYYFNLCDSTQLTENEFIWRDLIVDILVRADGRVSVLDEDELPPSLSVELRASIITAKRLVVQTHKSVIAQARRTLAGYIEL